MIGYDGGQGLGYISYLVNIDYVGGTNPIYIGLAVPSSLTSASVWQIRKLTFDGNNNVTNIQFANGSNSFNAIWDNRAGYSYS